MSKTLFLRFPDFRYKAFTLSYDDGTICDKRLVEILKERGLKGTFNLCPEWFSKKRGEWNLCADEVKELYIPNGMEVAAHGADHYSLCEVDSAAAVKDVISGREQLEKLLGVIIKGMAYANGSVDDEVAAIVKTCGFKYCRTTVSTGGFNLPSDWTQLPTTCHHDDPKLMEYAKAFAETPQNDYLWARKPRLFYVWGHSYEFERKNNWDVFERFADYISGRADVWYATNVEIFDYVQAFNRLEFSVDEKTVFNPTTTDLYICLYGKDVFVPAGKTVRVDK